jgi:hypothetical protein
MKRAKLAIWILLVFCLLSSSAFAVSEAALLFLLISPSPRANGMGQTFMGLPEYDAIATSYNPGSLGIFASKNYFSVGFYPSGVQWLPSLTDNVFYDSKAVNFGFNLYKNLLLVGLGYHKIFLNLGEHEITDEESPEPIAFFQSFEKARAISFGIGGNLGVKIGLGMSIKYIESQLGLFQSGSELITAKADIVAYDFGGVVQAPIFELLNNPLDLSISKRHKFRPYLVPALAYSMNNYGDEVKYQDESQADPIPRLARTGYSIDTGIILNHEHLNWKIISFKRANEAEDLLVKERQIPDNSKVKYQSGLGDIDFYHDVIQGRANPKITQKRGWEINCLEIFYYREGKYDDHDGKVYYDTKGYGVSLTGLIKFTSILFPRNQTIKFFAEHVDFQYHWSEIEIEAEHPLAGTKFKGFNLVIR